MEIQRKRIEKFSTGMGIQHMIIVFIRFCSQVNSMRCEQSILNST